MRFAFSFLVLVGAGLISSPTWWVRILGGTLLLGGMDRFGLAIKQETLEAIRMNQV